LAFARKQLTPGLNVALDAPKEYVNDKEGLTRKLDDFYLKLDWIERLDVTVNKETLMGSLTDAAGNKLDLTKEFVDDDFKRESFFLKQAEQSAREALEKLKKLNVPSKRPEDYFAEMAKSDDHMKRVRESLLSKHADMEKREKARKLRELKKMGKQIQFEVEKKKLESKKKFNEKVKKFKKGDKDELNIELEDEDGSGARKKRKLNENGNGDKKTQATSKHDSKIKK
jgi:rRNA-processing protein EBP2